MMLLSTATDYSSPNHDERGEGVAPEILVLHYTGMPTAEGAIGRLCDPQSRVSAHYVVDEAGAVFRLVPEERRAWHAGVSFWRGRRDLNARSIGVEIVNPGHEFGYRRFPDMQMAAVAALCADIVTRRGIAPWNVVGHSDIAPRRKSDPGELFDWRFLAERGIGFWPVDRGESVGSGMLSDARLLLDAIGYEIDDMTATVVAFQRRFRSSCIDGALDAETFVRLERVRAFCP